MSDLRKFDRRQFTALGAASLGNLLTRRLWAEQARATASPDKFYFALVADTHIIDNFYVKGSENGVEDNESILLTTPRYTSARDLINSLTTTLPPTTTSTSKTPLASTTPKPSPTASKCLSTSASATTTMTSNTSPAR